MSESSAESVNGGYTNTKTKGYQNDTLSPYFMHPNENPGVVLVTLLSSGLNYQSWSRSVAVALKPKHKQQHSGHRLSEAKTMKYDLVDGGFGISVVRASDWTSDDVGSIPTPPLKI